MRRGGSGFEKWAEVRELISVDDVMEDTLEVPWLLFKPKKLAFSRAAHVMCVVEPRIRSFMSSKTGILYCRQQRQLHGGNSKPHLDLPQTKGGASI